MTDKVFPQSQLPIRRTVELLPVVFQTSTNDKFMSAVVDPLVQPGVLEKTVGYVGRRFGKTYNGSDIYLDTDTTLRSRYQLEPGVITTKNGKATSFYDYLDFKNQLKFFGNLEERDDQITSQAHYSWNPPIDWDKFVNYREYFWEPLGPQTISVTGQAMSVTSTYKVVLGATLSSYVFTPDSFTNNPTITLYRGQTYNFKVNAPTDGFYIRTNYDTGSLIFDSTLTYNPGDLVVYNNKLWKAKVTVSPSTIVDSNDWEYVEDVTSTATGLDYNKGVTNNGIENGTLTFKVPLDAPDVLFYQSLIDPNRFGRFIIGNIEENTKIDIDREVIGKSTYTSGNGVEFTNGLVVEFLGKVTPSKYANDTWLVEGVGSAITLTRFADLEVPILTTATPEILFDKDGFDTEPFDDARAYPSEKDYITIAKNSTDKNPWSRYNRWFHRSVLEYSYSARGQDFPATESLRAKRPIIEFNSGIQLFNHGGVAKQTVDYIDTFTDDVFSIIEGSTGYNVDGESLFEGARVLVVADKDTLANNKIYEVRFIKHNNKTQITLRETTDSDSIIGEGVLVKRGSINGGLMFYFDGTTWKASQKKTSINQAPLFDMFDNNGVSFSDANTYPTSTFTGTELFSYKKGNTVVDTHLGFSLSYLNIDNVGDIQFNWTVDSEKFYYTLNQLQYSKDINVGFYKFNTTGEYSNGWVETSNDYIQPIIDSVKITETTSSVTLNTVNWNLLPSDAKVNFYLNGVKLKDTYTRNNSIFTFSQSTFVENDIVTVKVVANIDPDQGYYNIPVGLEKNPLNQNLTTFTLGQAIDHLNTSLEFDDRLDGIVPGKSNLRDLADYQKNSNRFLKHSASSPLAVNLLTDKNHNIIKAIQYAKNAYSIFKNNFLSKAFELESNDNIADFVDDIISNLSKTKNSSNPFARSDMIGSGAYTAINYVVEDTGIKTFSLSEKFTLDELSDRAVYVYKNKSQLLNATDYEFDSTFGFIRLKVDLAEGDEIQIREYVSTAFSFVPPTPTSMGMYKKYRPAKFLDDTYLEPRNVIRGHDGSITVAYGDFRDDLLLELELRIYNNIKQQYKESIFDIDKVVGGYYGNSLYTKQQLDKIIAQEFLKWIQNTNINYTLNEYFDTENSFTYTYSNMTDPSKTQNLPGWWRGVYSWFYDTDKPHMFPWEMLGFSEKPDWWESEYGPAPYTSNNLILWEDLRDGIIRQGDRAGIHDRYKRPTILTHIPVDGDGKLLSPLDSGLATNFTLMNNKGSFSFGDISPTESAWRSSSEYPFAVTIAMCLMKPLEFIPDNFNRTKTTTNILGQIVDVDTQTFIKVSDIVDISTDTQKSGLIVYLKDYIRSRNMSVETVEDLLLNLDVKLSTRLSGFVDQTQQRYLLDSKNPKSTNSSIYIPPENYDIIFNVSSPIASVAYSGVILEKTEGGWVVNGYDNITPYFNCYQVVEGQKDPLLSVGGVSEEFLNWTDNKTYNNGQLVRYRNDFYRSLKSHTSSDTFDSNLWKRIPKVPVIGAIEVFKRKTFNTFNLKKISYGTKFTSVQEVADFLFGYQAYLEAIGFKFDRYDNELQSAQDWTTSCKEFMFWTKHNWAIGSLITLSPAAEFINLTIPVGVADNILDGFYDYQVLKSDGKVLRPEFINVNRGFQNITVETTNTTEGLYYLKVYYVLKEHVTIFDDKTVFNDIIYDKTTGYRQERIKSQGFRTVDWDGDYTSPGFMFDAVNIQPWAPFTDYKLGDIVSYRSFNWTSQINQPVAETFNDAFWSKLDTEPSKQLVSNFDYKINQFDDYYEITSEGLGENQRNLARHSVGYQTREYLQNLAEDPVTQFQLYQGFIKEKGTSNAITKVFDKLSRSSESSVSLDEEWAFKVGEVGGVDQVNELEFEINKDSIVLNPQPILIVSGDTTSKDSSYKINNADFTLVGDGFTTNINPVSYTSSPVKTAGYVKLDQVNYILKNRDSLLDLDINSVLENDHIWITFDKNSWNVLRYNESQLLKVVDATKFGTDVTVTFNRMHSLNVDDIVGFKNIENLTGFFKVTSSDAYTIIVTTTSSLNPALDASTFTPVYTFTESRISSYNDIDPQTFALLKTGSKLWVDNNGDELWEVVEKKKQFSPKQILDYGVSTPLYTGSKVLYDDTIKQTFVSIPGSGYVVVYVETTAGLILKQIIDPPLGFKNNVIGSFGTSMAISPDSRFLVIGSPMASGISHNFVGQFNPTRFYLTNDIVLYNGKLWRARTDVPGISGSSLPDSSWINVYTDSWEPATAIPAFEVGRNPGNTNQGMISIYEFVNQRWVLTESLVSPRPEEFEKFGSEITIGVNGTDYYLAISAIGSLDNRGRVYLYNYLANETAVNTFSGETTVNFTTNTLDFSFAHNYYNGQKVTYYNGTIDGTLKSTADQPLPPTDGTVLYVVRIDESRIQLSRSLDDVKTLTVVNLLDFGIDDSSHHTLVKDVKPAGWYHIENQNYRGEYVSSVTAFYPAGSIVWHEESLWSANEDITDTSDSTTLVGSILWTKIDPVSTQTSLPQNISLSDDGSTLALGLLSDTQLAELVKQGDEFGYSMTMSRDGSILAIGAPNSDGQYFANYRGIWRPDIEYVEDDVVKYQDLTAIGADQGDETKYQYYRLIDTRDDYSTVDSTVTSINQEPTSLPWVTVGDSTTEPSGKVYIYQRSQFGVYELKQTITAGSLVLINDLPTSVNAHAIETQVGSNLVTVTDTSGMVVNMPIKFVGNSFGGLLSGTTYYIINIEKSGANGTIQISTTFGGPEKLLTTATGYMQVEAGGNTTISVGDQLGYALDIDYSGSTLVITSPRADANFRNQGAAFVLRTDGFANLEYRLKQKLESYEQYPNEYFGQSVSISSTTSRIVIGAKNSPNKNKHTFDTFETFFDQGRTTFYDSYGYAGAVYVYELKDTTYLLTEKLEDTLSLYESFGYSVDCSDSTIVVGSPDYRASTVVDSVVTYDTTKIGIARLFKKDASVNSLTVLSNQPPTVDISKVRSIALYDNVKNIKIQDLDYVDHAKLKVLNIAEKEIKFKTPYDPAVYNVGTDEQVVDPTISWEDEYIGRLWWDISTAKWVNYEQGNVSYRTGNWNSLAAGASIDVYEWVETPLLPSEWAALADTNEGISEDISGQPLYPNDDVYTKKEFYNLTTGELTDVLYYYWVKNKVVTPNGIPGRTISAASVANYISNPYGTGIGFVALIDSDKMLAYNVEKLLTSDSALVNIQYYKNQTSVNPIHKEYQLLTEGVADSVPSAQLEAKWIDSLIGRDTKGNRVPDSSLPDKQKYGLNFRPRQSMFVDRVAALKIAIDNINNVLTTEAFADILDFTNLNLVDEKPSDSLKLYDVVVDTYEDLATVGTVKVKQAILSANIVDGKIDTIDIIDPGFGYRVAPIVTIDGDGTGAKAETVLDNQGRIRSINILYNGKRYTSAIATVRQFSVLVNFDVTDNGFWSIYSWDNARKVFFRSKTQAFDTTKYWTLQDWWKSGYSTTSRIVKEIENITLESTLVLDVGDLIRVKEYGAGGWAVFEKMNDTGATFLDRYTMVARKSGTIQLKSTIYNIYEEGIGFDNTQAFDNTLYDLENSKELRNIFTAVKEDIFIGDYAVEWNRLFFNSVRYAFTEQQYIDWAFKTSFLNAVHNVGSLEQKLNYKNDNLESFQSYIDEIKPYRTTVREYVSRYTNVDGVGSGFTDFDSPATYSASKGKIVPITVNDSESNTYPWKWWRDNRGYSVVSIEIANGGSNYTSIPRVLIDGNGTGATAQAYVSNGKVTAVLLTNEGQGYTQAPTVTLVGGNSASDTPAKAVAVLGSSNVRTFNVSIKFDRISKTGIYSQFYHEETLTATGSSAVFNLSYAPTRDKTKIIITRDGQLVLNGEYSISLYKEFNGSQTVLKGKLIFDQVPANGSLIYIKYDLNDELLDSVNRINKFYSPTSGMKGKELNQLMTGFDFGGVQIQGTTFEVTGGWDALPWFTDNWDSVEASSDYYHICDGSTIGVTLPFVPAAGQRITVYWKPVNPYTPRGISADTLYTLESATTPVTGYESTIADTPIIRIDDPLWNITDDSATSSNPYAQMPTFVGDGSTSVVEIGEYLSTEAGDTLIFRPIESDGSVTITDPNLLDTRLSGGTLAAMSGAYATATGMSAEDITIDGGKFISPEQVSATEENIPGQVLDSVSIRVFNNTPSGAAPLNSRILFGNGLERTFDIGLTINEESSLLVYVDKIKRVVGIGALDFDINYNQNTITFVTAPPLGSIVELLSVGLGGLQLLDYQEFIADGATNLFLTAADYDVTTSVFVTINGKAIDVGFIDSTDLVDTPNKTLIQFATNPDNLSVIKIIALGSTADTDSSGLSIVRVQSQVLEFEGSTRSFDLDSFVDLDRGSSISSMIVEVNGNALQGVDTEYFIASEKYLNVITILNPDGTIRSSRRVYQFVIGIDPNEAPGAILPSNIKVFVNNELKTFVQDYVYDGTTKIITFELSQLADQDVVKIENNFRSEYNIIGNSLVIDSSVVFTTTDETDNDIITVTWFSEYPSMGIVSDEYVGGKVKYKLAFSPLGIDYVWVYKNGVRLTQDQDYYIYVESNSLYLTSDTVSTDLIKVILFGTGIYRLPSAFEIHKDMLNVYHFTRYSIGEVTLVNNLTYYDQQITVNDASSLFDPIPSRNIPGVIYINSERIEYLNKTGNVLSQLRRGSQGTAIGELYLSGSYVADVGPAETLPYNESQDRTDFVFDGSTILIGPLDFVPEIGTRNTMWDRGSDIYAIPNEYGPCDQIEVFVAGRRLRKDPVYMFNELDPETDELHKAEFSVDGVNYGTSENPKGYIRLTIDEIVKLTSDVDGKLPAGTRISVIKRTGKLWYEQGNNTITNGVTLLENTTSIAKFIAKKTTGLPE